MLLPFPKPRSTSTSICRARARPPAPQHGPAIITSPNFRFDILLFARYPSRPAHVGRAFSFLGARTQPVFCFHTFRAFLIHDSRWSAAEGRHLQREGCLQAPAGSGDTHRPPKASGVCVALHCDFTNPVQHALLFLPDPTAPLAPFSQPIILPACAGAKGTRPIGMHSRF